MRKKLVCRFCPGGVIPRPVYVELPGWSEDITGARSLEDLPPNARAYLDFVEEQLGIPVVTVGVGPARDEIIWTDAAEPLRSSAATA